MSYLLIRHLARVRDEYEAARGAIAYLQRTWHQVTDIPETRGIRFSHVWVAAHNIEDTYIIRLVSEFEGLLISYLAARDPGRRAPLSAESHINRVARRARIPDGIRESVHLVREYRNSVIHRTATTTAVQSLYQALAALNRFLDLLPDFPF